MSHHSAESSAGAGLSSSPFAGTDPTMYSPELTRNSRSGHRRNVSQTTIIAVGNQTGLPVDDSSSKGKAKLKNFLIYPGPYKEGAFVNEIAENDKAYISRHQFISRLADGTIAGSDFEHEFNTVQHQMKLYACFYTCVPLYNHGIHLRFDDLHDSVEGKEILEQQGFTVEYISGYDYAIAKSHDTAQLNEFEGQIKLPVLIHPTSNHAVWEFSIKDLAAITKSVELTTGVFGSIRTCVHVDTIDAKMLLIFRIEYHSVDAGNRAVQSLRKDPVWGENTEQTYQWLTVDPTHWTGEHAMNSPHRTKPAVDDTGRLAGYRVKQHESFHADKQPRHPQDHTNRVRRERILDGSDVRTTIMLRNIPNKLDWMSLKAILDSICFGMYDFVYLRIDFKSGCNVGYAFINFVDIHGMISLIDRLEHRAWSGFNSNKCAEISYATIQGREALMSKFRNSSVMQETPFCRPRLYYTYGDAGIMGQLRITSTEQPFPIPDNLSKLQRSMDSARSIGLYPPSGGSTNTEHRTRTSNYDRGTPRDMMSSAATHTGSEYVPFADLSESIKREIETWYSKVYGASQLGFIRFENVPLTHVNQYLTEVRTTFPLAPGVIGGPINTPFTGNHARVGGWINAPFTGNHAHVGGPINTPFTGNSARIGGLANSSFGARSTRFGSAMNTPFTGNSTRVDGSTNTHITDNSARVGGAMNSPITDNSARIDRSMNAPITGNSVRVGGWANSRFPHSARVGDTTPTRGPRATRAPSRPHSEH